MSLLGRDWAGRFAARFGARLRDVSFTRANAAGVNPADPAGPPIGAAPTTWTANGAAFGYAERDVDGESVMVGDYRVLILLGTVSPAGGFPRPGDMVSCPPPGTTIPKTGRVVSVPVATEAFATCQVRGGPA